MPRRVSVRVTFGLIALAFAFTFGIAVTVSGGSSGEPAERQALRHAVAGSASAAPDLRLASAAAVPRLRDPRRPHRRPRRRTHPQRQPAKRALRTIVTPAPTRRVKSHRTVKPTATAAPRYVAPAPPTRPVAPPHRSVPRPAPTSPPQPAGDFDTSSPQPAGDFDTSG
jgi:hypothetical protein